MPRSAHRHRRGRFRRRRSPGSSSGSPRSRAARRRFARSTRATRPTTSCGASSTFLRARTGHDFSSYKRATVMRRVRAGCRSRAAPSVARIRRTTCRATPEEAQELFGDLLISVTMFFRDPDASGRSRRRRIAPIFDNAGTRTACAPGSPAAPPARRPTAWPSCCWRRRSGGKVQLPIQIFATDLDEGALATRARGPLPGQHRGRRQRGAARAASSRRGHALPRQARRCATSSCSRRTACCKDPPFMRLDLVVLPQPADLSGARAAEAGLLAVPLRAAAGRLPVPRLGRDGRRRRPIFRHRSTATRGSTAAARRRACGRTAATRRCRRATGYAQAAERRRPRRGGPSATPPLAHASAALERPRRPACWSIAGTASCTCRRRAGRFLLPGGGPFTSRAAGAGAAGAARSTCSIALGGRWSSGEPTLTHARGGGLRRRRGAASRMQVAPVIPATDARRRRRWSASSTAGGRRSRRAPDPRGDRRPRRDAAACAQELTAAQERAGRQPRASTRRRSRTCASRTRNCSRSTRSTAPPPRSWRPRRKSSSR